DVHRQIRIARTEQGHPQTPVEAGRRGELQHRKAEGGERSRLDQVKAETLHSREDLGTVAQHHDLARLEPAPSLATGAGLAGQAAAAAGWRRDVGSAAAAAAGAAAAVVAAGAAAAVAAGAAAAVAAGAAAAVAAVAAAAVAAGAAAAVA